MIDKKSKTPLYVQIQEVIIERISTGEYGVDKKVHSEHEFCKQFSVGRPTVRQAIAGLVEKDYLESFRGKGVFVKKKKTSLDLFSYMGTTEAFSRLGKNLKTTVLDQSIVKSDSFHYLDLPKDKNWLQLIRMRYVDEEPIIWERTLINKLLVPGLDKINLENESLLNLLAETYSISFGSIQQYFGVRDLNIEQQKAFKYKKNKTMLYLEREIECNTQNNNYFVQIVLDTDKYRLYQKINSQF